VSGAFCNQCGTPVSAAGAPAPGQPAPAGPYTPPVAPYTPPSGAYPPPAAPRKTSPVVLVLLIIAGVMVLGGLTTAAFIGYGIHKVRQAVTFEPGHNGGMSFQVHGDDGKSAHVEFGNSTSKLPSWVPVYPGSEGHSTFSVTGTGDGQTEGGSFIFTTSDAASRVKSFYKDKCRDLGLKVNLETNSDEGGMIVASDEGAEKHSLSVVIGGQSGQTTVNVTYGLK
jgi:hypothetical protein